MSSSKKNPIRIELTPDQRKAIKAQTGKNASAIELTAQELEDRIAPMTFMPADE